MSLGLNYLCSAYKVIHLREKLINDELLAFNITHRNFSKVKYYLLIN